MKSFKDSITRLALGVALAAAIVVAAGGWIWLQHELAKLADGVGLVSELSAKGR